MKNLIIKWMALGLIVIAAFGCEKKVNDWEVDSSHNRLFKSLVFEVSNTQATSVKLRYTKSIGATKYVFEFSKDSLEFNNIVKTVEVLADTLTPFATSTTPTRVEYRTDFGDLDGTSGYSVRMKSVDTSTGSESKYSEAYFETPAEQLFDSWEVSTDNIQMYWTVTDRVTDVLISDPVTGAQIKKVPITADAKSKGTIVLDGLSPGTQYQIAIYNGDVLRGTKILTTSGIKGALLIAVNPGDDIGSLVAAAINQGRPDVTLLFKANQVYNLGSVTLPSGLANISFTGEKAAIGTNAQPAVLNCSNVAFTGTSIGKMIFEKVDLVGGSSDFLVNLSTDNLQIDEYDFLNCLMENYKGVIRVQNKVIKLGQILINNSQVNATGGYGVINVGGSSVSLDSIKVTNSTLIDMNTQLMDVRAVVPLIAVTNNTIYNVNSALTQLIRLDKNNLPGLFEGGNNIISGNNAGADLKSFSLSYEGSFAGSYRTSEMSINTDFPEITVYPGAAADLFVNPVNGDFHIKEGAGFGGTGIAGDPRWW